MASSAGPAEIVGPLAGSFCFVCLVDTARKSVEFECLVLEITSSEVFIAIPGTANQSSAGEWV